MRPLPERGYFQREKRKEKKKKEKGKGAVDVQCARTDEEGHVEKTRRAFVLLRGGKKKEEKGGGAWSRFLGARWGKSGKGKEIFLHQKDG